MRNLLEQSLPISQRHFPIIVTPEQQRGLCEQMCLARHAFGIPAAHGANDSSVRASRSQGKMTRINPSFIQHPRMPVVNTFHSQSQQAARTDYEGRKNVSDDWRPKQAHQQIPGWLIVCDRANQHQLLNQSRMIQRYRGGDRGAVRTANQDGAIDSHSPN